MEHSVKRNYFLNLVNTLSGLLFPIITFPYISRILLADGIGQIQFYQSVINYIALFSALGIPLYAVREIARIRDNERARSKTVLEILILHTLLTLLGYVIVFILIGTVEKISSNIPLFLLLSLNLFFTALGAVWFYQAIEDFKYVTIRSLVVRTISLIALFVFVRNKTDVINYAAIIVIAEVGSHIFNFYRLWKFIRFGSFRFSELELARHIKPATKIFVLNLIISIYVNLDSVMLGFLKDDSAVGFYAAATRLTKALMGIVACVGTVLLPRLSNLIATNKGKEFYSLANKAVSFVIALSLPLALLLLLLAPSIIYFFCGKTFAPSVLTLEIISPIIIFISLSGLIGMQILYPLGKENLVILATAVGAGINFTLNYFLIPLYAQYGAAFATSLAELCVLFFILILGKKYHRIKLLTKQNLNYLWAALVMLLFMLPWMNINLTVVFNICFFPFYTLSIYFGFLWIRKDPFVLQILNYLLIYLKK